MIERDKVQINQTIINNLFEMYNNPKTSNRITFIHDGLLMLGSLITENELCLIWQAFDRAAEEWQ